MARINLGQTKLAEIDGTNKPATWKLTFANGGVQLDNVPGTVAIRGNSTATQPKKPFKLDLTTKANIFNFIKDDGFYGLAEYFDQTGLKNLLCLRLAKYLGLVAPLSRVAEVYDGNGYQGLYTITERPKSGIVSGYNKLTTAAADQQPPNITGSYIYALEADYQEPDLGSQNTFKTKLYGAAADFVSVINSGVEHSIAIEYPKPTDITAAQTQYAVDYYKRAEASLYKPYADTTNGPLAFYEKKSLLRSALFEEFIVGVDSGSQSERWGVNRSGKLFRICWDFDGTFPYNGLFGVPRETDVIWALKTPRLWVLVQDLDFRKALQAEWLVVKQEFVDSVTYIQAQVDAFTPAMMRNVALYGVCAASSYSADRSAGWQGYLDNVAALKTYATNRIVGVQAILDNLSTYDVGINLPGQYNYQTTLATASIIKDVNGRVSRFGDSFALGQNPLLADVMDASAAVYNPNVGGYPALDIPSASGGGKLHYKYLRTTSNPEGYTLEFYVRLNPSSPMAILAASAFAQLRLYPNGVTIVNPNDESQGVSANMASGNDFVHIVASIKPDTGFIMLNGVAVANAGGIHFGSSQLLSLCITGSVTARLLGCGYSRAITVDEATKSYQLVQARFPVVNQTRATAPTIQAQSPSESETQKFFRFVRDTSRAMSDYAVTYNKGDSFMGLSDTNYVNGVIEVPLPSAFYLDGVVGLKLIGTSSSPESPVTYNTNILGYPNYLGADNLNTGSNVWTVSGSVSFGPNGATFQQGASLYQQIPGGTLRRGDFYDLIYSGTGEFDIVKAEPGYGGSPTGHISLNNSTQKFVVDFKDWADAMIVSITATTSGSVLTKVAWTFHHD